MDVEETPVLAARENIMVCSPLPCRSHKSGMIPHRHHRHPGNREIWPNMIWVGGGGSILWEFSWLTLPARPPHWETSALPCSHCSKYFFRLPYNLQCKPWSICIKFHTCLLSGTKLHPENFKLTNIILRCEKTQCEHVITCRGDNLD